MRVCACVCICVSHICLKNTQELNYVFKMGNNNPEGRKTDQSRGNMPLLQKHPTQTTKSDGNK